MAMILPDINGSTGVWGTILNDALNELDGRVVANTSKGNTNATAITTLDGKTTTNTNAITGLNTRVTTLEGASGGAGSGGFVIATSTTLPALNLGQIIMETDTGYLSYDAKIGATTIRVPFPGQWVAKLRKTNAQSMGSISPNPIAWNTASLDRLKGYVAGSPTLYTCKVPGIYEVTGGVGWEVNSTGYRRTSLLVSGAEWHGSVTTSGAVAIQPTCVSQRATIVSLVVGDTLQMQAQHNAGVSLDTTTTAADQPVMNIKYLGYIS